MLKLTAVTCLFKLTYTTTKLEIRATSINLIALLAFGIATVASASATAASTKINLREGGDLTVAARTNKIAFQLAGRIWSKPPDAPAATPLTDKEKYSQRPVFSPDASLIAYESLLDGFHQIIVMRADGSEPVQVTFGKYHHRTPAWLSTSNSHLVMSSNRGGDYGIWELNLESLALNQLTFLKGDETEPAWNSNDTKLAFVKGEKAGSSLYSYGRNSGASIILTEEHQIRAPSWRPGAGVLTYVRESVGSKQLRMLILSAPAITKPITQIETVHPTPARWIDSANFLYAADGRIKQREFGTPEATEVPFEATVLIANEPFTRRKVDFGDDGNRPVRGVSGISRTPQNTRIVAALGDLWEFSGDDSQELLRQLTNDAFVDAHPAVSPDGSTLAFVSDREGTLQIWLMDLASMRRWRITSEKGVTLHPSWNSDSTFITYLVANHATASSMTLKRVTIANQKIEVLTTDIYDPVPTVWDEESGSIDSIGSPENRSHVAAFESIPLTWRAFKPTGLVIIQAGRIFDGIGPGYITEHEIVIQGNRIVEVRPWTDSPSAEQVIDARQYTVLPGLIDLSVQQPKISGERVGRAWLAYGVTTIRESVLDLGEAIERQESWRSGRRIGPRMLMALKLCNQDLVATRSDELDRQIRMNGVTLIEMCGSIKQELLEHAIAIAHDANLPIATSAPFPGILLGVDEIRVGEDPTDTSTTLNDIATVAGLSGKIVVSRLAVAGLPGLSTRSKLTNQDRYRSLFSAADRDWYADSWNQHKSSDRPAMDLHVKTAGDSFFRAIATGARVAAGSNAPWTPYGLGLHAELQLLADIGLQPFQILKMASLDAARLLGAGEQLGSIRKGKLADMLVIDGDPLKDISEAENIVITVANGRAFALEELISRGNRANSVGKFYNSPPP